MRAGTAVFAAALAIVANADAQSRGAAGSAPTTAVERIDYLTFAQGAVPIRIEGAGARLGANYERAIRIIDGNPQGFTLTARPFGQDAGDTIFGGWRTMGLRLQLKQEGAVVSGCYDRTGDLTGTVTGNILRATGVNRSDKTPSTFILSLADDGSVRGVRSDNGGPFSYYTVETAAPGTVFECGQPAPPTLGCGSIIHGINFDFDSAVMRPESNDVLAALHKGLAGDNRSRVVIEGHTSSEGTDDYNLRLSERRAQAVVADLVTRGLAVSRVAAAGLGESRPIATNSDENGRSLNRRVEVKCQ